MSPLAGGSDYDEEPSLLLGCPLGSSGFGEESVDWHTRLTLATGILDGEKDAHRILADMLDESGERALAEWCRAKKSGMRKRLEIVIGVVPHRMAVRAAAEFLRHAIRQSPEQFQRLGLPAEGLEFVCVWSGAPASSTRVSIPNLDEALYILRYDGSNRTFAEDYQFHYRFPAFVGAIRQATLSLYEAVQASRRADSPEAAEAGKTSHFASETATFARRVARLSTTLARQNSVDEMRWQVTRTRRVIEETLGRG